MKKILATLLLLLSSVSFAGQRVDDHCQIAGCSGEICTNISPKEDDGLATTCEYKDYYECFKISSCVLNESSKACGWDRSPQFLSCLKEKKAPNSVIQLYAGRNIIRFLISVK